VIHAPFAGRVGLRRVSVGSLVNPGAVITTRDDTSRMKLDFSVRETCVAAMMLVGLAAKNGILIVEFANQLRDRGVEYPRSGDRNAGHPLASGAEDELLHGVRRRRVLRRRDFGDPHARRGAGRVHAGCAQYAFSAGNRKSYRATPGAVAGRLTGALPPVGTRSAWLVRLAGNRRRPACRNRAFP